LDGSGDETVAGGRVGYRLGGSTEVGTTYVHEQRGGDAFVLRGADMAFQHSFGRNALELGGEAASTTSPAEDPSAAASVRAGARRGWSDRLGATSRNVGIGFENPSGVGLSDSGPLRWGVDGTAAIRQNAHLRGEMFTQNDERVGTERRVGTMEWEQTEGRFTATTGLRDVRTIAAEDADPASSRMVLAGRRGQPAGRLPAQLPRQPAGSRGA